MLRLYGAGSSMRPAIPAGAALIIEPATARDLRLGDVVVYRRDATLVAHRLVGRERDGGQVALRTKGDILAGLDVPLPAEGVLGRVVAMEHDGRRKRLDTGWSRLTGLAAARLLPVVRPALSRVRQWGRALCTSAGGPIS